MPAVVFGSKNPAMIISKLQGGLGNQMFQFAIAKSLSDYYKTGFRLDTNFLLERANRPAGFVFRDYGLDILNLKVGRAEDKEIAPFLSGPSFFTRVEKVLGFNLSEFHYLAEPHYHYSSLPYSLTKNIYLDGYWQSEKYFERLSDQIRKDFSFKQPIAERSENLFKEIYNSESVCVNVRRGDFLQNDFHPVCDMGYFSRAMSLISSKIENPHFFIFSDDKAWCHSCFTKSENITVVGEEHDGFKFGNKLQLMSWCRHFIIPNSSFAWWAAWLSSNPAKVVIAPQKWFNDPSWNTKDLILPGWTLLDN
jgi:hypothetical protein